MVPIHKLSLTIRYLWVNNYSFLMYARVIRGTKDCFIYLFFNSKESIIFCSSKWENDTWQNDRKIEYGEDNDDDITYH